MLLCKREQASLSDTLLAIKNNNNKALLDVSNSQPNIDASAPNSL